MALGLALAWLLILNPLAHRERHPASPGRRFQLPRARGRRRDELGKIATEINRLSESLARERENLLSERESLVTEGTVLRHVLDAVDDGLVMMDAQGHIMLANRNATRLLGDDFARLSGRTLGELLSVDHPLTALVRTAFEQGGKAASAQLDMPTPEGPRTFLASCQVVGEDTTQAGGILALRDFGRMREIQAIIDHARVLSRLGKMAAGVAHEIRNPLNAMNIHLELLRQNLGAAPGGANGAAQGIDRVAVVQREITRLERVVYGS
jgi:nitrogen fixation/metabolism regulation signal transduction histidine kinase